MNSFSLSSLFSFVVGTSIPVSISAQRAVLIVNVSTSDFRHGKISSKYYIFLTFHDNSAHSSNLMALHKSFTFLSPAISSWNGSPGFAVNHNFRSIVLIYEVNPFRTFSGRINFCWTGTLLTKMDIFDVLWNSATIFLRRNPFLHNDTTASSKRFLLTGFWTK